MAEATLVEAGVRGARKRRRLDAVAAAFILQSFLEHRRGLAERAATGDDV
jgi:RNase H-fold protein (predicted Holliday junction resolvase)